MSAAGREGANAKHLCCVENPLPPTPLRGAGPSLPLEGGGEDSSPSPFQGEGRGEGASVASQTAARLPKDKQQTLLLYARSMRRQPTPPEQRLWNALRRRALDGHLFRRQAPVGPFILDFYCPACAIVVEVDGATHADPATDRNRDAWLHAHGIRVLRFWNNDVMANLPGVLEVIGAALRSGPSPQPSPWKGEGAVRGYRLPRRPERTA